MKTHGLSRTKAYRTWVRMLHRCYDPKDDSYPNYGGRGITVCDRWRNDFEAFLADVGNPPSEAHSIDRRDNDGNYEPGNVRWVTKMVQDNNRRTCRYLELHGYRLSMAEWARLMGVSRKKLWKRLSMGWSVERVLDPFPEALYRAAAA
jgi:hypothetical protein